MEEVHGGLKVIGAGFGRTGTYSLKVALELLGFGPCYHMREVFQHPEHVKLWNEAIAGRDVAWNAIFGTYRACVDWPGCTFYKELMQAYPEAKVLLTVRDPEKWYESAYQTIYQVTTTTRSPFMSFSLFAARLFFVRMRRTIRMIDALIWNGTFGGNFLDKELALEIFAEHNEEVKRSVPAERLLIYNVKEGWEPLCAFLGVPVPSTPFPHVNDRENFIANRARRWKSRLQWLGLGMAGLVALVALLGLLKRRT
ncbi:sulfotransferase family protein [Ktedonosporobacter rubrisoli]|uniref:sulfotransferase family protein n=1 Tax=Ktedonosporobacter rubrisoli TaxID=2509675 RepID=UPI0013EE8A93|nr:sulfotransferase family protein [Ktedonosporobacter rubrisoli]